MFELWTTEQGRHLRRGFVDRVRSALANRLSRLAALVDAPDEAFVTLHRPRQIGTYPTEAACHVQATRLGLLDYEVFGPHDQKAAQPQTVAADPLRCLVSTVG